MCHERPSASTTNNGVGKKKSTRAGRPRMLNGNSRVHPETPARRKRDSSRPSRYEPSTVGAYGLRSAAMSRTRDRPGRRDSDSRASTSSSSLSRSLLEISRLSNVDSNARSSSSRDKSTTVSATEVTWKASTRSVLISSKRRCRTTRATSDLALAVSGTTINGLFRLIP